MMPTARTAVINIQERRTSPADSVHQFSMIHSASHFLSREVENECINVIYLYINFRI